MTDALSMSGRMWTVFSITGLRNVIIVLLRVANAWLGPPGPRNRKNVPIVLRLKRIVLFNRMFLSPFPSDVC